VEEILINRANVSGAKAPSPFHALLKIKNLNQGGKTWKMQ
jgi:hypothetical protein